MGVCTACGSPLRPGSTFCTACGQPAGRPLDTVPVAELAPAAAAAAPLTVGSLAGHLLRRLPLALLSFAFSWVLHTYLLVIKNDGFEKVSAWAPYINVRANAGSALAIWSAASALLWSLLLGVFQVGPAQAVTNLVESAVGPFRMLGTSGNQGRGAYALGAGLALLLTWLFPVNLQANVSLAVAAAFLGLPIGLFLARLLPGVKLEAAQLVVAGIAPGFLAAGFLPRGVAVLGGLGLVVLAVVLWLSKGTGSPGQLGKLLAIGSLTALVYTLFPRSLFAHDGGWTESNQNFDLWWRSPGRTEALTNGTSPAVGAGLGPLVPLPGTARPGETRAPGPGEVWDPWQNRPLPRWEPGRYGPGENGQEGKPGQVWFGGNWVDPEYARDFIRDSLAADQRRAAEAEQFAQDAQRRSEDWLRNREAQLQQEAEQERRARQTAADLDRLRDIADRHNWDDIWDRAIDPSHLNADGSVDPAYVNRLRDILRDRLRREQGEPLDSGYQSPFTDFVNNTWDDIRHNPLIRIGTGVLSGGSSEVYYQSQSAWDAMQRSFDQAADHGHDWGLADALRSGYGQFARDNLPLNTIEALADPNRRTVGDVLGSFASDVFSAMHLADTARNLRNSVNAARAGNGWSDILQSRAPGTAGGTSEPGPTGEPPARPRPREDGTLGADEPEFLRPPVRDAEGRINIDSSHPWDAYRNNKPLPPEMRNPGMQLEPKDCVPTAVSAVHPNLPRDRIEELLEPFRRDNPGGAWPKGGVPPHELEGALNAADLKPRPLTDFINPTGGPVAAPGVAPPHIELADRAGQLLSENPNLKIIAPVKNPLPDGSLPMRPNHVVVVHSVTTDLATGQVTVHAFDPARGNVSLPADQLSWNFNQSYVVKPPPGPKGPL